MADEIIPTEQTEAPYALFMGGETQYWDGIPARDLTKAEWDAINNENIKNHLIAIGLYKLTKKAGK